MALHSRSSVVIVQTLCRKTGVTSEQLSASRRLSLLCSVVGHESTVHGRNRSCDDVKLCGEFAHSMEARRDGVGGALVFAEWVLHCPHRDQQQPH